jgi:hypothetical protein
LCAALWACTLHGGGSGTQGGADAAGDGPESASAAACDHVFDVLHIDCAQAAPPADEIARLRQRYGQVCLRSFALPGVAVTPEQLSACADAVAL